MKPTALCLLVSLLLALPAGPAGAVDRVPPAWPPHASLQADTRELLYDEPASTEQELLALNNLVEQYLIFATGQAMRRIPMYMADWIKTLDAFLTVNERDILLHAGTISHEMAKELAEGEYDQFNLKRIRQKDRLDGDFDKTIRQLTNGTRGKKT